MGQYQADQHSDFRAPRGEVRKKGAEDFIEEIMAETIPMWGRKQTSRSRKPREFQR